MVREERKQMGQEMTGKARDRQTERRDRQRNKRKRDE